MAQKKLDAFLQLDTIKGMKKQRRQSQNSLYMREILTHLREFDLEETRMLCEKYKARMGISGAVPRRKPRVSDAG